MTARASRCPECGAPLRVSAASCAYCRVELAYDAPAEPSAASFLGKLAKALHGDADRRAAFELAAAAAAPHTEEDEEVFAPLAEALGVGDPEAVAARVSRALG